MRLIEIIENLDVFPDELTIYANLASSLTPESEALVAMETKDGQAPEEARGMSYLLEVSLAKEIVDTWRSWRGGKLPTTRDKYEAIKYYIENDAYLAG